MSGQAAHKPPWTSQTSTYAENQGNPLNSFDLTNLDHIVKYNALRNKISMASQYFDKDLLTSLELLDNIRWLFAH